MHRHGLTRLLSTSATLLLVVGIAPLRAHATSEVEQHLRDQYNGKTFVLRNFYRGDRLSYDSAGSLVLDSAVSGDWTVDGFTRVISLDLHGQSLTIQAERLSLLNNGQAFQFGQHSEKSKKNEEKKERKAERGQGLRIDVEFDAAGITAEKADAALSKVFLTSQDRLPELVPDYWASCVRAASTGNEGPYSACSFPEEFSAIPGVRFRVEKDSEPEGARTAEGRASNPGVSRTGRGTSRPTPIFTPDPHFSEQASRAKYHGTVTLSITVDETGMVRNIRIVGPLGMGLDQKAVDTVSKWRFNPARRDGQPVAVEMAVEVDFHLY
jgi:TonB family protein